jgi:hypothetical protein
MVRRVSIESSRYQRTRLADKVRGQQGESNRGTRACIASKTHQKRLGHHSAKQVHFEISILTPSCQKYEKDFQMLSFPSTLNGWRPSTTAKKTPITTIESTATTTTTTTTTKETKR